MPGRVSTEVDANLSFNTDRTLEKARAIIRAYDERGVSRDRVLIRSPPPGRAFRRPAYFSVRAWTEQPDPAVPPRAGHGLRGSRVFLISPFVGRITRLVRQGQGKTFAGADDPGVQSVRSIYAAYKSRGLDTVVMGASFRNVGQIQALAGCDTPDHLAEAAGGTSGRAWHAPARSVTRLLR